jgi:HlyD family secretion protein
MGIGLTAWRGANRRWVWFTAAGVVVLLGGGGTAFALTSGRDGDTSAAASATVAADTGAVTTQVATTGTLQAAQTRTLSFSAAGTVETVKVTAGSTVTAGQVLATIGDDDAAAAVEDAEDALDEARDALTAASSSGTSTTQSTTGCMTPAAFEVTRKTAEPSASATASPSATATSPSPSATTTTRPTQTQTQTSRPTQQQTAPQQQQQQQQRGGTAQACGTQQNGQQGGQQNSGDPVLSAQQRVNQAEVTLENAQDALDGTTITAPIKGRILSVAGKVGSQVGSGSTFVTLADVYDMQVSADFPEADAGAIEVGQKATATVADSGTDGLSATVVQVDPAGTNDGTMVRYGVVLSFTESPEDALVGQSAAVRVTTGSKTDVVRVPSTAVHDVADGSGTVLKGGARVSVGVGLRGDAYTEITSGLIAGDVVSRSW